MKTHQASSIFMGKKGTRQVNRLTHFQAAHARRERKNSNASALEEGIFQMVDMKHTWWLIPLSKWVITPVINGISRVNPLITGVITHLLSGMSHQVWGVAEQPWLPLEAARVKTDHPERKLDGHWDSTRDTNHMYRDKNSNSIQIKQQHWKGFCFVWVLTLYISLCRISISHRIHVWYIC